VVILGPGWPASRQVFWGSIYGQRFHRSVGEPAVVGRSGAVLVYSV